MAFARGESLDTLPDELLAQILEYVGPQSSIPLRFRLVSVLSTVNRRLRAFALPVLLRNVRVLSAGKVSQLADLLACRDTHYAQWIRSLRIGRRTLQSHDDTPASLASLPPLPNLVSFEWLDCVLPSSFLHTLKSCKRLKSLSVRLPSANVHLIRSLFTLEHVRIHAPCIDDDFAIYRPWILHRLTDLPSLTTLCLNRVDLGFIVGLNPVHFPALRVLSLHQLSMHTDARDLFAFIGAHPELRDVNVAYAPFTVHGRQPGPHLLLHPLVKLAMGTGVWHAGALPRLRDAPGWFMDAELNSFFEDADDALVLDDPCVLPERVQPGSPLHPFCVIQMTGFAFRRRRNAYKMCPAGHRLPEYVVEELAVKCPDEEENAFYVFDLSGRVPALAYTVQHLTIDSECVPPGEDFCIAMTILSRVLPFWDSLQTLSLAFPIPPEWTWGSFEPQPEAPWPTPAAVLDDVQPPVDEFGRTLTLAQIQRRATLIAPIGAAAHAWADEVEAIRTEALALGVGVVPRMDKTPRESETEVETDEEEAAAAEELDEEQVELMVLWEERHHVRVARAMRMIADSAPKLVELRWYVLRDRLKAVHAPLWRWRITRESKKDEVTMIVGDLTWKGSMRGEPDPIRTLVGQELVWARQG